MEYINIIKFSKEYFTNIFSTNDNSQILDPLSTVVRMVLLNYKPIGTKISIYNNKIHYQEPSIIQGTIRWHNGDKRTDLHNLLNPLLLANLWFNSGDSEIEYIFSRAMDGLENIKKSYKDSGEAICHAISHYITILNSDDKIKKEVKKINNVIYNKIHEIWSQDELNIIYSLLKYIDDLDKNDANFKKIEMEYYVKSIESIIDGKDKIINSFLNNTLKGEI